MDIHIPVEFVWFLIGSISTVASILGLGAWWDRKGRTSTRKPFNPELVEQVAKSLPPEALRENANV